MKKEEVVFHSNVLEVLGRRLQMEEERDAARSDEIFSQVRDPGICLPALHPLMRKADVQAYPSIDTQPSHSTSAHRAAGSLRLFLVGRWAGRVWRATGPEGQGTATSKAPAVHVRVLAYVCYFCRRRCCARCSKRT